MNSMWKIGHCLYFRWCGSVWGGGGYRLFELVSFIIGSNAISVKASIGQGTVFHHRGIGCVVHEKTSIGSDCHIFQNVTMGSKWSAGMCEGGAPTIGNNVMIGAGACILGNITIGDNCVIGANTVVTKDIPDNSTVVGIPGKIIYR